MLSRSTNGESRRKLQMERASQVALRSGWAIQATPSRKSLSDEQVAHLVILLKQTAARYSHQDLAEAMPGYLHDFEMLALRYGMDQVQSALLELRIRPGQRFFPQPSEVAEVVEEFRAEERKKSRYDHSRQVIEQLKKDDRHRAEHPEEYSPVRDVFADFIASRPDKFANQPKAPAVAVTEEPLPAHCPCCSAKLPWLGKLAELSAADLRCLADAKERRNEKDLVTQ